MCLVYSFSIVFLITDHYDINVFFLFQDEIDIELSSVPADGSQSIDGTVKIQANPKANLHQLLSRQVTIVQPLFMSAYNLV